MSKKLHLKGKDEKTKCGQDILLLPTAVLQEGSGRIYIQALNRYITQEETQFLCEKCLSSRVNPLKIRDVALGQAWQLLAPIRMPQMPSRDEEGGLDVRPIRLKFN